ncbi:MAG: hypothetical protein WDW36_003156 [Sanguina aurantia]
MSQQLLSVLKSNTLLKPKAHAVLSVAGLDAGDITALTQARQYRVLKIVAAESTATSTTDALAALIAANPDISVVSLEQLAAQDASADIIVSHLSAAAKAFGITYESDSLTSASGVALDLSMPESRMFAVELSSYHAGLDSYVKQVEARPATHRDVELVEMSILGLQGLVSRFGASSPEVEAAKQVVFTALTWGMQSLDEAFSGDVTLQVNCLDMPPSHTSAAQLAGFRERMRRQLATSTTDGAILGEDEDVTARRFSTKAAGYGAFLILLYFSMAAIYCMCFMPIKKDSLLYGTTKKQE